MELKEDHLQLTHLELIIFIKILKSNLEIFFYYGDITDSTSVSKIIKLIKPDEIYNLAAQSHVAVSEVPEYTATQFLGALRILRL